MKLTENDLKHCRSSFTGKDIDYIDIHLGDVFAIEEKDGYTDYISPVRISCWKDDKVGFAQLFKPNEVLLVSKTYIDLENYLIQWIKNPDLRVYYFGNVNDFKKELIEVIRSNEHK